MFLYERSWYFSSRSKSVWCAFIFLQVSVINCQGWIWLGGEQIVDRVSTHQYPGGRSGASTWHDVHTNLTWMFGGQGFSYLPSGKPHLLNDIWHFSPAKEANGKTKYFVYHNPRVSTTDEKEKSNQNLSPWPVGRHHACMCGFSDKLVLFGGLGESGSTHGDLWIYDLRANTWTQTNKTGPTARGHPGVWCFGSSMYIFGGVDDKQQVLDDMWKLNLFTLEWTLLQPSNAAKEYNLEVYLPQGRNGPATWVSNEALYMFGGNTAPSFSYSLQRPEGLASDLWRYFPCNSSWDLVSDPFKKNQNGIHSSAREHHPQETIDAPGARIGAGSWVDSNGNLWLFGGAGVDSHPVTANKHSQVLSDVWRFNIKMKSWAFIGGSREGGKAGMYKSLGKETEDGQAGARTDMMVFPGSSGKTYIFGGLGHDARQIDGYLNDLWCVDVPSMLSAQYAISAWSLLLFLGACTSLLVLGVIIGFSSRDVNSHGPMRGCLCGNADSPSGSSDHRYRQLKTSADF